MTGRPSKASRELVLKRLRSRNRGGPPLPELDPSQLTRYDDPIAKFVEMLSFVGGQSHLVQNEGEVGAILAGIDAFSSARQVLSLVPQAVTGNVEPAGIDDPHSFASLDWVIAPGEFPVAENGAIWVSGEAVGDRVLLFLPQYLAIVVSRSEIVHHMHEAYTKIGKPRPGFGVFVSGPSKTADIEQSLVLGAHGCRALQVFLTP